MKQRDTGVAGSRTH